MKFHREQYLDLMTFGHVERPMFVELFGPLVGLEQEWRAQGATEDEINMVAFDWDYVPIARCGATTELFGGPQRVVLEDTDTYRIERDELGRTIKLPKKTATVGLPMNFPVRDMDNWLAVKPLYTFCEQRIDWDQVEAARSAQAQGCLVVAHIPGAFDTARELMGEEVACLAYYDQPQLMADLLQTLRQTAVEVLQRVSDRITIDQLSVHEDLAGKSGPLIGPEQIRQFVQPYFTPVWDLLASRGTRVFEMDTDGFMNPILDALLECGLNAMHPMEPAAGVDIVELRKKYGQKLAFRGGIDKFVLQQGKAEIRQELEYKLQPMMRRGGTVFGLDHRIPNGTPLENYRYYVDLGREILDLPPRDSLHHGWQRMAF